MKILIITERGDQESIIRHMYNKYHHMDGICANTLYSKYTYIDEESERIITNDNLAHIFHSESMECRIMTLKIWLKFVTTITFVPIEGSNDFTQHDFGVNTGNVWSMKDILSIYNNTDQII